LPGSSFMIQNRITWFGCRFIRGGEEFREDKGTFILGADKMNAPYLDDTERSLAWLYFIWLAPGSLVNAIGVVMTENEDGSVCLSTRTEGKPDLSFRLDFDPENGQLKSIHTTRKGSRSGDEYPYLADLNQPRKIIEDRILPIAFTGDWDHDVYIKLELAGMQFNQDISEAMQTGIEDLPV
jgi:hypothetical protein